MENTENKEGFLQGQYNAIKDVYKKTDANEVLNKILDKIQSIGGFQQGTELGDALSGFSDIAKNITAPFKQMTAGWNQLSNQFKNFKEAQEEKNKQNDKHDFSDDNFSSNDDYAKDEQVIDLGNYLKSLINSENNGFELIESKISDQQYFLEDIQSTVGQLIYGTDAVIDQLKKNQKNTKVFQVSKKEMTLAEKAELSQGTTQIGLLAGIQSSIAKLDTDLNEDLADAIQQGQDTFKEEPDADFKPEEPKPNNDFDKKKAKKQDSDSEKQLSLLGKIGKGITDVQKYIFQMARMATVAALKTVLIIGGITALIIGIDIVQANLRASWDNIMQWFQEFKEWLGQKWDAFKEQMAKFFKEYIQQPIDTTIFWFKKIDQGISNLSADFLDAIANLIEQIPGFDKDSDSVKYLRNKSNQIKTDVSLEKQKDWDDYANKHGKEAAEKYLGSRPEVQEYKMDDNTLNQLKAQAEKDKNSNETVTLQSGENLSLNQSTEDLEEALRQYAYGNNEVAKQNREIIENLLEVKKQRDDYVDNKADEKEFSIIRKWWNHATGNDDKNIQNQKEVEQVKQEATTNFNEEYLKNGIQVDTSQRIKDQISEKERQAYDYYSPDMQLYRQAQLERKEKDQNNVQVNNQNNNTNIINQPLNTRNPYSGRSQRTNIGQE